MIERRGPPQPAATSLVDILDRVLDKGLVVAGDIRVSLANVELLTVQVRLLVCSIDKAQEIGLDWWRHDGFLSSGAARQAEVTAALQARVEALERQLQIQSPESASGGFLSSPESAGTVAGPAAAKRATTGSRRRTRKPAPEAHNES